MLSSLLRWFRSFLCFVICFSLSVLLCSSCSWFFRSFFVSFFLLYLFLPVSISFVRSFFMSFQHYFCMSSFLSSFSSFFLSFSFSLFLSFFLSFRLWKRDKSPLRASLPSLSLSVLSFFLSFFLFLFFLLLSATPPPDGGGRCTAPSRSTHTRPSQHSIAEHAQDCEDQHSRLRDSVADTLRFKMTTPLQPVYGLHR